MGVTYYTKPTRSAPRTRPCGWDIVPDGAANADMTGDSTFGSGYQDAATQQAIAATASFVNRIYVGSIAFDVAPEIVQALFNAFGRIREFSMTRDTLTGRHKGFCFVEYDDPQAAANAQVAMNGFPIFGRACKVGRPNMGASGQQIDGAFAADRINDHIRKAGEHENLDKIRHGLENAYKIVGRAVPTYPPNADIQTIVGILSSGQGGSGGSANKIYVGSVNYEISEEELKTIFSPFGQILSCQMIPNPETGRHKGYGFIEFSTEGAATEALRSMNGFELAGRPLRVGAVNSMGGQGAVGMPMLSNIMGGSGGDDSGNRHGDSMSISSQQQRQAIMQKLAGADSIQPRAGQQIPQAPMPPPPPAPMGFAGSGGPMDAPPGGAPGGPGSRAVVLDNMVTIAEVDPDLEYEVKDECSKHGPVQMVTVFKDMSSVDPTNPDSEPQVRIFVMFVDVNGARSAQQALHGRWFGGRQISAAFYDEQRVLNGQFS